MSRVWAQTHVKRSCSSAINGRAWVTQPKPLRPAPLPVTVHQRWMMMMSTLSTHCIKNNCLDIFDHGRRIGCTTTTTSTSTTTQNRRLFHISSGDSFAHPRVVDLETVELDLKEPKFDLVGTDNSLLSITLPPSQEICTRRGSLIALYGRSKNVISKLLVLAPLARAPVGIPFLYRKIRSTTPVCGLVSAGKSKRFAIVHVDGTLDWVIAKRDGLIAWSGSSISVVPHRVYCNAGVVNWAKSLVRGRGTIALAGNGQICEVLLKAGEQFSVHSSNIIAYSTTGQHPRPIRFRWSASQDVTAAESRIGTVVSASTTATPTPTATAETGPTPTPTPTAKTGLTQTPTPARSRSLLLTPKQVQKLHQLQLLLLRFPPYWRKWTSYTRNVLEIGSFWTRRVIFGDRVFLCFTGPSIILIESAGSGGAGDGSAGSGAGASS